MRVRKIAKQLKRFYESYKGWDKENEMGIYSYHLACFDDKVRYMIRMSIKHYFVLAKKYPPNSMMSKLYIHNMPTIRRRERTFHPCANIFYSMIRFLDDFFRFLKHHLFSFFL